MPLPPRYVTRLPFFYGWVVVGIAFLTMAVGVNTRTAFSLLFPPILDEFGWDRATLAATFTIGFVTATFLGPLIGAMMDRFGPRFVIPVGTVITSAGLASVTLATQPWHFYLTLGVLAIGGSMFISYVGHSLFLPNWFNRRRGLAIGIAFSGVGVGSIILFPWLQHLIGTQGWRTSSLVLAVMLLVVLVPLNAIFQRHRPQHLGLLPDGDAAPIKGAEGATAADGIVDRAWVETDWTLGKAIRTRRYWWLMVCYVTGLYAWYSVQVHQTRFLIDIGITAESAAIALGLVGLTGIGGQIAIGHFSDRVGREWGWTLALIGYALTYSLLLVLEFVPEPWLVYAMVSAQGFLGYGLASIYGTVAAELFAGRRFGVIFGVLAAASGTAAGVGPFITGAFFDVQGDYRMAFGVAIIISFVSIFAMWMAAPRKVRLVAGQIGKK